MLTYCSNHFTTYTSINSKEKKKTPPDSSDRQCQELGSITDLPEEESNQ